MKKRILILLLLMGFNLHPLLAQYPFLISGEYLGGTVTPHREGMEHLKQDPVNGAELEIAVQLNGNDDWHVAYHYPVTGLGLHYDNLGYDEVLGYAAGFYGFIDIPLRRWEQSELIYKLSSGLTHNSKRFLVDANPTNIAISTRVNYLFNSGFHFRYWMSDYYALDAGVELTHYSNGAIRKPNKGLNQLNVNAGLSYYLTGNYDSYRDVKRPIVWDPSHEIYLLGVLGKTNIYKGFTDPDHPEINSGTDQTFFTGGVSIGWNYRYAPKRKAGLSLDGFYNESFNWSYWDQPPLDDKELTFWELTRAGIGINHEFFMKRLSIFTGFGIYVVRSPEVLGSKADEWMYERLGFRYYILQNVFLNVSVKAYGFKAEAVEFGMGLSLNRMYSNFW
ncbi:MAG: acyloxyacyl hydrolase [Bacteroidota bacterium]|nr:acyloxyacyl hydrolase [Bacteroidota bacterium]